MAIYVMLSTVSVYLDVAKAIVDLAQTPLICTAATFVPAHVSL